MSDVRAMKTPETALAALFAMQTAPRRAFLNELTTLDLAGLDEATAAVSTVAQAARGPEAEAFKVSLDKTRTDFAENWGKRMNFASPEERAQIMRMLAKRAELRQAEKIAGPMLARAGVTGVPTVAPAYQGIRFASNAPTSAGILGPRFDTNPAQQGTDAPLAGLRGVPMFNPTFTPSWSGARSGGLAGFTNAKPYQCQSLSGLGSWLSEAIKSVKGVVQDIGPLVKAGVGIATGNPGAIASAIPGIVSNPGATAATPTYNVQAPATVAASNAINPSGSTLDTILGIMRVLTGNNQPQYQPQPLVIPAPAPAAQTSAFGNINPTLLIGAGLIAVLALSRRK